MQDITIRPANLSDFDTVYSFLCDLENEVFDRVEMRRCFEICLNGANHIYLIAFAGAKPVGYISCHGQILMHHCGWVYEIQELYVLPEQRGKGIGKMLVDALEKLLERAEYKSLEVTSNLKRTETHQFYVNNGFEQTSLKFAKPK